MLPNPIKKFLWYLMEVWQHEVTEVRANGFEITILCFLVSSSHAFLIWCFFPIFIDPVPIFLYGFSTLVFVIGLVFLFVPPKLESGRCFEYFCRGGPLGTDWTLVIQISGFSKTEEINEGGFLEDHPIEGGYVHYRYNKPGFYSTEKSEDLETFKSRVRWLFTTEDWSLPEEPIGEYRDNYQDRW